MAKQNGTAAKPPEPAAERLPAYFLSLTLENVRCFGPKQTLNLSTKDGKPAPWTIILGVNGTGKTTLLQSLAGFSALYPKSSLTPDDDFDFLFCVLELRPFLRGPLESTFVAGITLCESLTQQSTTQDQVRCQIQRLGGHWMLSQESPTTTDMPFSTASPTVPGGGSGTRR